MESLGEYEYGSQRTKRDRCTAYQRIVGFNERKAIPENNRKRVMSKGNYHDPLEFLTAFLEYCQEKEKVFSNALIAGLNLELQTILHNSLKEYFIKLFTENDAGKSLLPVPLEYIADFYVGGLMISTMHWLKDGCKIPKERLAACQYRILKSIFKQHQNENI